MRSVSRRFATSSASPNTPAAQAPAAPIHPRRTQAGRRRHHGDRISRQRARGVQSACGCWSQEIASRGSRAEGYATAMYSHTLAGRCSLTGPAYRAAPPRQAARPA